MSHDLPLLLSVAFMLTVCLWPLLLVAGGVVIAALVKGATTIALVSSLIFVSPLIVGLTAQIVCPVVNWFSDTYVGQKLGNGLTHIGNGISGFYEWTTSPSLVYAVKKQDEEKVGRLLKKGKNPNCHGGSFDYTPLQQSCLKYNDIEKADRITLLLLDSGADPNIDSGIRSQNPLHMAIYSERKNAIKALMSHGAEFTEYTIGDCFKHAFFEEAEQMLNQMKEAEKVSPCACNDAYDSKSTVLMYIMKNYDHTYEENFDTVKRIFTMIMEKGCDVNAQDSYGRTAISIFAFNATSYSGQMELAKSLIKAGADVRLSDNYGDTPLIKLVDHYTFAYKAILEIIRLFLANGSDITTKNYDGQIAIDVFNQNYNRIFCRNEDMPVYDEIERLLTPRTKKVAMLIPAEKKHARTDVLQIFIQEPPRESARTAVNAESEGFDCEKHTELFDMLDNW